jgi:cell fate regulator YaaT (PSP1 superfamily)
MTVMSETHEYLVGYGTAGDFGRFRPTRELVCQRGDRVVVRSHRGMELGEVLCEATPGHAQFLPNTTVGPLLRVASPKDEQTAEVQHRKAQALCAEGRRLAGELGLPLDVLDAEILLDDAHAVVQYLRWAECDYRPLVSALSKKCAVHILMHDLAPAPTEEETEHGCGRSDCGRTGGGGGCGSCSSGGCSTCGSAQPEDVSDYFAGLRAQMEAKQRTPLL